MKNIRKLFLSLKKHCMVSEESPLSNMLLGCGMLVSLKKVLVGGYLTGLLYDKKIGEGPSERKKRKGITTRKSRKVFVNDQKWWGACQLSY